jgi:hypothetical protein
MTADHEPSGRDVLLCPEGFPMKPGPWIEMGGRYASGLEWRSCGCLRGVHIYPTPLFVQAFRAYVVRPAPRWWQFWRRRGY